MTFSRTDIIALSASCRCVRDGTVFRGWRRGSRFHRRRSPRQTQPSHHLQQRAAARRDQARVAHHPGEQVLRRHVHRPEPEQLPVEDAARPGCPAEELLRDRPLQHGQLPVHGVRPGARGRHARGLQRRQQADRTELRHHQHRLAVRTSANYGQMDSPATPPSPAAQTRRSAPTAAPTRPTCRPCSTSSTRPGRPGRATRRTSAARRPPAPRPSRPTPSRTARPRRARAPAPRPTTRTPTRTNLSGNFPPGVTTLHRGAAPDDQYVAKHFPFPWFESLTGGQRRPGHPGAERTVQRRHELRLRPRRQPRQPRPTAWSTTCKRQDHPGLQLDHPGQLQ